MRKILCLLLALLILSVGCIGFAFRSVSSTADQVELTETVVFGDKSNAEGLTVLSENHYLNRLHWATTYVIGNENIIDTAYHFTPDYEYESSRITPRALYLSTQVEGHYSTGEENPTGLGLAYKELYESMGPNDEQETEVYVKDYYNFYPLTGWFELSGYYLDWNIYTDLEDWFSETDLSIIKGLENFFRFPVLEDDKELISLTTNAEKNIVGSGSGSISGDDFYFNPISPYTDEAIYIAFDAHTNEEKLIDTSHIPGGYGIYRLAYHDEDPDENGVSTTVDIDELAMVYPLELGLYLLGMTTSADGGQLLLHTREKDAFYLTVIDTDTMDTLQKLELGKWSEDTWGWRLYDEGEGFLVFLLNDHELIVAEQQTDGTYAITLRTELLIGEESTSFADYYLGTDAVMAYDGEQLAVIDTLQQEYTNEGRDYYWREETCGFYAAVYDTSGLVYFGTYESSLDAGEDLSDEFHQCTPDRYPLSVNWN